jgi:hypothetical protein
MASRHNFSQAVTGDICIIGAGCSHDKHEEEQNASDIQARSGFIHDLTSSSLVNVNGIEGFLPSVKMVEIQQRSFHQFSGNIFFSKANISFIFKLKILIQISIIEPVCIIIKWSPADYRSSG